MVEREHRAIPLAAIDQRHDQAATYRKGVHVFIATQQASARELIHSEALRRVLRALPRAMVWLEQAVPVRALFGRELHRRGFVWRLNAPFRITLRNGRATDATGEPGAWLLKTLETGGPLGRNIAELGIGTNPAATMSGNVLEDEKVIGTVHLAFGTNAGLGGQTVADVHIDCVLTRPSLDLDGTRTV